MGSCLKTNLPISTDNPIKDRRANFRIALMEARAPIAR